VCERDESSGSVREIARREFFRRWGIRCSIAAAFAATAYGGFRVYASWREDHLARQTQQFVERGDYRSAVLVARRLLDLDPGNLAALEAMAEMAENAGRVDAVTWRTRIAQVDPGVTENQLRLAKTALRFRQLAIVENILRSLPESARQGARYHQLAGAQALSQGDPDAAERHFAEAVAAEPTNPQLVLNLATLRLASRDRIEAEDSRASLARLVNEPSVRTEALRALAADALAHSKRDDAAKWAAQLKHAEGSTFSDVLLYFQAVQATDAAAAALEELKSTAAQSPATAAELITWLNRHQMAVVAAHWGAALPAEIRDVQPVPLAIAETYSFQEDWTGLQEWVEDKNWGEYESLRLAVHSHALHRLAPSGRVSTDKQTVWRAALRAAHRRPEQLVAIARLAEGWGYGDDAEEAWWMVANTSDQGRTGLSALQRLYKANQNTRGLWRVARRAIELNPGDIVAANNCASLGLLLTGDSTSRRLAAKLHAQHPTNRAFAATYAFALQTEGKLAEALQLMESLKEEELRHPSIAAYYFVMLVESGNMARARNFLAHAKRANLLPEERELLTAATRKLLASETADGAKNLADS
jgi:Flp pilus assembly protein TadD